MSQLSALALRVLLPLLLAVSALASAFWAGGEQAEAQSEVHIQKLSRAAVEEKARRDGEELKKEKEHRESVEALRVAYLAQRETDRKADALERGRLAAGADRLRFAVRACEVRGAPTGPSQSASAGADGAPGSEPAEPPAPLGPTLTAELAPDVAASLFDLVSTGDEAITQLTSLQAWARKATEFCQ